MVRISALLFSALLLFCESVPTDTGPDPAGTWGYSSTMGGYPVTVIATIESDKTYAIAADGTVGSMIVPLYREYGVWSLYEDAITFSPSDCRELDTATGTLVSVDCGGPSIFTVSGNSLTSLDGTIIMTRRE